MIELRLLASDRKQRTCAEREQSDPPCLRSIFPLASFDAHEDPV